jgi:hypothetical protein
VEKTGLVGKPVEKKDNNEVSSLLLVSMKYNGILP